MFVEAVELALIPGPASAAAKEMRFLGSFRGVTTVVVVREVPYVPTSVLPAQHYHPVKGRAWRTLTIQQPLLAIGDCIQQSAAWP